MMKLLKDRAALITGAGSPRGIGRATALLFAEHGASVGVLDIDEDAARQAAGALPGEGHFALRCDVTDADHCQRTIEHALKTWGRLDILVNSAGIARPNKTMEINGSDYDAVMDVNLRGTLLMCQAVIPAMREQHSGSIINMASVAGQRGGGIFGGPHYAASKAAVLGLTKAMARELGPDNVRVNAVCPSLVDTDIFGGAMTEDDRAAIVAGIPLGRVGKAHEIAGCVLFLASNLSSYVTGSELDVNGGSHIH